MRKRGILEKMPDMPIDVLIEVGRPARRDRARIY